MKKIEHLPINWVNGQKINNSHFFETYYNVIEMLRQNREESLTSYNYGFGEKLEKAESSIDLDIKGETAETLTVQLKSCNAVTRNGFHILFTKELYGDFIPECTLNGVDIDLSARQVLCILLTVNPYKMLPVGIPDPETTPLHHPYVLPEITIQLVLEQNLNKAFLEGNSIIAGKIIVDGGAFATDIDYIPAIQRIDCSEKAITFLEYMTTTLERIHDNSLKVYSKNVSNPHRSMLADNTFAICDVVKNFYGRHIFELKNIVKEQSPVHIVHLANALANLILTSLRSLPEKDFETLLQYFDEWTNIKPSDFMHKTSSIAHLEYNHLEINILFTEIASFLNIIDTLFHKLSELEYVGLIKENIIISEDNSGKASENERKSWKVWD